MSATTVSRTRRILSRVSQVWGDLDYAQRRLLEINSGVELTRSAKTGQRADTSTSDS
jgi:hypothetical protein